MFPRAPRRGAVPDRQYHCVMASADSTPTTTSAFDALALREGPSEALRLAGRFAQALERYLQASGGAASRAQVTNVVRTWVPRWDADVPPLLASALIEGLVRQGRVVASQNYVGMVDVVGLWSARFKRYPQRLTQPAAQVARDCDLPASAVVALRALYRQLG